MSLARVMWCPEAVRKLVGVLPAVIQGPRLPASRHLHPVASAFAEGDFLCRFPGCCNKLSQMWWLKTAEFCSLRVLEAEVPMRYRGAPSVGSMETVLLAFPTSPRGSRGPSAHVSTAQSLPPSSHGLLPFPHRNPVLGLRIHLLNPGGSPHEIPNLTVFAEVPLPSKVPVHQARFRGFRCGQPFWGPPFGLPVCCSQLGKEKHMAGCARGWL